jgi:hypothetical protein
MDIGSASLKFRSGFFNAAVYTGPLFVAGNIDFGATGRSLVSDTNIRIDAYADAGGNRAYVYVSTYPVCDIYIKGGSGDETFKFVYNRLYPASHKESDCGGPGNAWNNCYAYDYPVVGDFFWLDKWKDPKTGIDHELDDVAIIESIHPSEVVDPATGFFQIDDDTLHKCLIARRAKQGVEENSHGYIVDEWQQGDEIYDRDGKPYVSLKTMISLLMGAVRQLSAKNKALEGKIK